MTSTRPRRPGPIGVAHRLLLAAGLALAANAGCGGAKTADTASAQGGSSTPSATPRADSLAAASATAAPAESGSVALADPTGAAHPAKARRAPGEKPLPTDPGGRIFVTHCMSCHGPEGRGDGPGLLAPDPTPPDFHDMAYMSTRTDSMLLRSIRRGKGEAAMPRWDRILSEEEMRLVLGYVRKFGGTP